jgi:streptogramin lyase
MVVRLVVLTAVVLLSGVPVALAATEKPLVTFKFSHAGTACQSTLNSQGGLTYNLPAGQSETGIAFDGAGNLYVSCWGDATIDQIDLATGLQTIYAVSGGSGFGALTFKDGTLWACNNHADDVGTIGLNSNTESGVFTHTFTAAGSGCTDALAFDSLDQSGQTMWMGNDVGTTPKTTGKTLDQFVAGAYVQSVSVAATIGHRSGIIATPTSFVLAQPVAKTTSSFAIYQSTDRTLSGFTQLATWAGARTRPEDLECDPVTFAPKTAVWVILARKDVARAYQIRGGC